MAWWSILLHAKRACFSSETRYSRALRPLLVLFSPKTFIDAYGFDDDKVYIWGGIVFLVVEFLLCAT